MPGALKVQRSILFFIIKPICRKKLHSLFSLQYIILLLYYKNMRLQFCYSFEHLKIQMENYVQL